MWADVMYGHKHRWWGWSSPYHGCYAEGGPEGSPTTFPVQLSFQKFIHTIWLRTKFGLWGLTSNSSILLNHWHGQILLWNPPEERRSYLNGLFTKAILEEKYSVGTEGSELQQNLGSLRHTLEQGQQCLLTPASASRFSPSVPHCRVPLIFITLLINYMEKQTVAQGSILLTVFSTGNVIIQVLAKENKPRMSINIWNYLAAR